MRVLVTGASGFVGRAACTHLEELGHELVRFVGPKRSSDAASFSVDVADATTFPDPGSVSPLDAVVHCAGIAHRFGPVSKEEFDRVNVAGVENVVLYAKQTGARKFVLLSSVLVYGTPRNSEPITENFAETPDDDYGLSKLSGERIAVTMCEAASIKLAILRPAPILGEGSHGNVARLVRAIDRGRFVWIGDGLNRRSFVYVGDVIRAISEVIHQNNDDVSVFNIVGGTLSVAQLVGFIEQRLGRRPPKVGLPTWATQAFYHASRVGSRIPAVSRYRRTLAAWLADAVYSGDKIEHDLGFVPQTTIEEAIGRDVDHYLKTK